MCRGKFTVSFTLKWSKFCAWLIGVLNGVTCRNKHSFSSSMQEQRAVTWYKCGKYKGKLCGPLSFAFNRNRPNASCRAVRQMADDFNKRIRDVISVGDSCYGSRVRLLLALFLFQLSIKHARGYWCGVVSRFIVTCARMIRRWKWRISLASIFMYLT